MENSFDSTDRLVEFGMSMAVARQMIATMNNAMADMRVAGADMPLQKTPPQYYAVVGGSQAGPLTDEEVETLVASGRITGETLIWKPGMMVWEKAASFPEINKMIVLNKIQKP